MEPFRLWAGLPPDLLCRIGDLLELKCYASARGACTAWRRSLVPPSPALLVAADRNDRWRPNAASLPTRRSFELTAIASGGIRCVGSSNGWLVLSADGGDVFVLLNPVAPAEIVLPPLIYKHEDASRRDWVSKVVFTPCPAEDDFAAAAICDVDRVAYVTAGAKRWAVMDPVRLTSGAGDQLADLVYADKGKVYCLSKCGDVHVLRLPKRQRRKPAADADEAGPSRSEPKFSLLHPPPPPPPPPPSPPPSPPYDEYEEEEVSSPESPEVLLALPSSSYEYDEEEEVPLPPALQGPHLNAPATLKPLLPSSFDAAAVFAPPYDTVSAFTGAKNLVFCEGNLYQVWRNTSCAVTVQLPAAAGGGQRRVAENEVLVLRYYPRRRRRPCWDAVKDLGGYSLFVGRNNAVSMYAEGVPGLRGNCVYWIGGHGRDQGMVFDMESGRSTPCGVPQAGSLLGGPPFSTICWYFMSDVMGINRA